MDANRLISKLLEHIIDHLLLSLVVDICHCQVGRLVRLQTKLAVFSHVYSGTGIFMVFVVSLILV